MGRRKKIRKGQYAIEDVLALVQPTGMETKIVDFDEDPVKVRCSRLKLFKLKGVKCVTCDMEGKYFVKEKCPTDPHYHFVLLAENTKGEHTLMTQDHIKPRSLGGKGDIENLQPMCAICNNKKGNTYIEEDANLFTPFESQIKNYYD